MADNRPPDPVEDTPEDAGRASGPRGQRCLRDGDALLIIDVQNDFLPEGSLPVPLGDRVIPPLNHCISRFQDRRLPVLATRDWHPADHCSFDSRGGRWPPHCVRGTAGARFAPALYLPQDAWVLDKATDPDREAFSDFAVEGFDQELRRRGIKRLIVGGLATEYCVHDTVLDALRYGFQVVVLLDAIRPIEAESGDGARAVREMAEAGAELLYAEDLCR